MTLGAWRFAHAKIRRQLMRWHDGFGFHENAWAGNLHECAHRLQEPMDFGLVLTIGALAFPQEAGGVQAKCLNTQVGHAHHGTDHF